MASRYKPEERLERQSCSELYRGTIDENEGLLIAVPGAGGSPAMQQDALNREYTLRSELDSTWAAVPLAPGRYGDQPSLLLKDPGGHLLRSFCGNPLPIDQFLPLAVAITSAVAQMHSGGLIHLRISPDNLLVKFDAEMNAQATARTKSGSWHAWLTGFGFAQRAHGSQSAWEQLTPAAESFAYLSPEQTSTSLHPVDARADLYALGCTFYELLAGAPPLAAKDPLGWAHAHAARQPLPIQAHLPALPRQISAIVTKLLEKNLADRYRSADSLCADLERCLRVWRQTGSLEDFPLNLHDIPDRLARSTKLYARESDIKRLEAAFVKATQGTPGCLFVCGTAGSGKSSLVHEYLFGLTADGCASAASKCEPATQGVPYAGLAQALDNLVHPLLGADHADFEHWRSRLQTALCGQGRALLPLVPYLEHIVGSLPSLPCLPPQAEKDRFFRVVGKLLGAFTLDVRAVVLFIDDLQWSDEGTLSVLEYLVLRAPLPHLLIIGSFRDDEVAPSHPLYAIAHSESVELIALASLTRDDVAALLCDLLHVARNRVRPLAGLIVDKTYGNPFFTIQFISALAHEELIAFQRDGHCVWHPARIEAKGYTNNVVDLLLWQIELLPVQTRDLLHVFSCLGGSAPVDTIAFAADVPIQIAHDVLSAALDAKLIQRIEDSYAFAHDRILETSYLTISGEQQRAALHLQIGRRLKNRVERGHRSHSVFEIVNHLNRGAHLIDRPAERDELAALNLQAGLQAKASMAYADALAYLRFAVSNLSVDRNNPSLETAGLHLAECEFITDHMDEAEARLSALALQASDLPFGAEVTRLRAALYTARDRSDLAVEVGLQYLRKVGIDMPEQPCDVLIIDEYRRLRERMRDRTFDELKGQPEMSNPMWRGIMQVLADLIPPALFTAPNLPNLISLHMTHLSLEHGVCDASCYGYVCVSEVFRRFGDYQTSYQFAELSIYVAEARGFQRYKARAHMCFGLQLPWTHPVREALPHIRGAFDDAMQAGDLTFATYCRRNLISPMIVYGAPLAEMQQLAYDSLVYARSTKFELVIDAIIAQITYIDALRGTPPDAAYWTGDIAVQPTNRPIAVFSYWTHRMQLSVLFGDFAAALDAEARASTLLWSSGGHCETALFGLFSPLVHAAACRMYTGNKRAQHLSALKAGQKQLDVYAHNSPHNFRDGATLVAAEIARIEQRVPEAVRLYEEAISYAREQGFLHNEALASELAAQFHSELGAKTSKRAYLRNARQAYVAWGADAKVIQLDAAYPDLIISDEPDIPSRLTNQLDVDAVITATHALSREVLLTRLVETLMKCTLELAGGQRCVLVTTRGDTIEMQAEAKVRGETVDVEMKSGAASPMDLPLSLARTVVRTGEMMVLDDARTTREWPDEPYLREIRPRSVICLPLLNQSRLVGLLYVENNLIPGAFAPGRASVLGVLSTHAAISLENARLYTRLVEESAEREHVAERLRTTQAELARTARLTTMGELVASIVHEVNQPITAANTCAQAAQRWLNRDRPEIDEARRALKQVSADTTRAGKIVRGLLSLAKKSPPEMKRFDLNEAIREVLQLLRREIVHHDVTIDDLAVKGELAVYGDRVQLQQVLINLIVNAMEAMSDLPPEFRKLSLSSQLNVNGQILVSVIDTGPGIDEAVLGKVFDPFVTTKDSGMGMGLSICRSIVEAHGGKLTISANLPHGARFQFNVMAAENGHNAGPTTCGAQRGQ